MNALLKSWPGSWRAAWRTGLLRKNTNLVFSGITGFLARAIAGFGLVYIAQTALESSGQATMVVKQILWSLYTLFVIIGYVPRVWANLHRTPQSYTHYLWYVFGYWILLVVAGAVVMAPLAGLYALAYGITGMAQSTSFKIISTVLVAVLNGVIGMMVCAWIDRHKGVEDAIKKGFNVFVSQLPYLFVMMLPFLPLAAILYGVSLTYNPQASVTMLGKVSPLVNAFWQLCSWMVWVLVYQSRKGKVEPLKKRRSMRKRPMRRVKKS